MYEFFLLYVSALLLGLVFCALPDAVNAEALRRGIKGGFRPSFFFLLGSCVGEMVWAVIALVGLSYLVQNQFLRIAFGFFGGLLLFYLAYKAFKDVYGVKNVECKDEEIKNGFFTGALISLCNPFEIVFWLWIGGSFISVLALDPNAADYIMLLAGYLTGSIFGSFLFAGVVAHGRRYLSLRIFRGIYLACGSVLVVFGLVTIWGAMTG